MCVNGPVLRGVLVVLLLGVSYSYSKRKCNYTEILSSYRKLILVELEILNLTGSFETSKGRDHCPSGKVQHVLRSIHGMTRQFLCQTTGGSARLLGDIGKPVERMEQLIKQNCRHTDLVTKAPCPPGPRTKGKKRKRMRLIKLIKALIHCWQKLQSMYTPAK